MVRDYQELGHMQPPPARDGSTLLLIIDMEPRYRDKKMPGGLTWRGLNENVARINDDYAARGIDTIHVALDLNGQARLGSHAAIKEQLANGGSVEPAGTKASPLFDYPVVESALVAVKTHASVETSPPLMQHIRDKNYQNVILVGNSEHIDAPEPEKSCVTASALYLAAEGYRVTIAAEGTNAARVPLAERRERHPGVALLPHHEILAQCDVTDTAKLDKTYAAHLAAISKVNTPGGVDVIPRSLPTKRRGWKPST